jgi:hypothetical protein
MLTAILWLFGIDLEQKVLLLKGHIHDAVEETSFRFRRELQGAGLFVIFAGLGAVALAAAMAMAAAALFLWIQQQYGPYIALAAVGGLCAVFAVLMFTIAMVRRRSPKSPVSTVRISAPPQPATTSATSKSTTSTSTAPRRPAPTPLPLSMPPLSANASLVDQLTHRFGQRALAASDEAVERAEALMREGSSSALLTTLACAALIGIVIGRRGGFEQHH